MATKYRNYRRHAAVLLFAAFFITAIIAKPGSAQAAFGISPPFLNADHLVKGISYSQIVYLVQDQPNEDLTIKANVEVDPIISSWIQIDKGTQFVIPTGMHQFPVQIIIKVPNDANLGIYHGKITFTSAPNQTGQVTIALGAQVAVNLTVGNDIFEKFSVPIVRVMDIEEGWNPRVFVKFSNEGNVPAGFTGATLELLDQFNSVRLAYIQKSTDFKQTPAFTSEEYIMDFPTDFHLGTGQYWGNVNFYQNDKLVGSQKSVFNVLKGGSLSGPGARIGNLFKNNKYNVAIGAGLLLLIVLFIYLKRRSRAVGSA